MEPAPLTQLQNMNDATDHPPVIDTGLTAVSADKSCSALENFLLQSQKNSLDITKILLDSLNQTSNDFLSRFCGLKPKCQHIVHNRS